MKRIRAKLDNDVSEQQQQQQQQQRQQQQQQREDPDRRDPGLDTLDDIRANIMQMSVFEKLHKVDSSSSTTAAAAITKLPTSTAAATSSHDKFPATFTFNSFDPLQEIISAARNDALVNGHNHHEKVKAELLNEGDDDDDDVRFNKVDDRWKLPLQDEERKEKEKTGGVFLATKLKVFPKKGQKEDEEAKAEAELSFPSGFPQFFGGSDDAHVTAERNAPSETMMATCPSTCACVCSSTSTLSRVSDDNHNHGGNGSGNGSTTTPKKKKLDVDISLYPCARSAGYQLNIALKMCKRKKSMNNHET